MKQVHVNFFPTDPDFTHEYNILDEDATSYLFRSNGSNWTQDAKEKLVVSVEDNGNGIVIQFEGEKKIKLDYGQAQELFILLLHTQDSELEFKETKTTMKWPSSQ